MLFLCAVQTASQLFRQHTNVRFLDDVDVVAGDFIRFNATLYEFTPAVVQVVVRGQISGEEERHVPSKDLRDVIFDSSKVNFLNILQCRRQRPTDLAVKFIGAAIQLVLGFLWSIFELAKHVRQFFRHTQLAQVRRVRTEFSPVTASALGQRSGPRQ
jgi:hypothetical protein